MEIEKKFLVKRIPKNLENYQKKELSQGYISDTNPTIRIRKSNNDYILTIKSVENIQKDNRHLMNNEFEFKITKEKFDNLSHKINNNLVEKTRYFIDINNYIAELDIYHNALSPLITVEVEFPNLEEALCFQPPDWFGLDITENIEYKNFHLAAFGLPK